MEAFAPYHLSHSTPSISPPQPLHPGQEPTFAVYHLSPWMIKREGCTQGLRFYKARAGVEQREVGSGLTLHSCRTGTDVRGRPPLTLDGVCLREDYVGTVGTYVGTFGAYNSAPWTLHPGQKLTIAAYHFSHSLPASASKNEYPWKASRMRTPVQHRHTSLWTLHPGQSQR